MVLESERRNLFDVLLLIRLRDRNLAGVIDLGQSIIVCSEEGIEVLCGLSGLFCNQLGFRLYLDSRLHCHLRCVGSHTLLLDEGVELTLWTLVSRVGFDCRGRLRGCLSCGDCVHGCNEATTTEVREEIKGCLSLSLLEVSFHVGDLRPLAPLRGGVEEVLTLRLIALLNAIF